MEHYTEIYIIGAGFLGATLAERCAAELDVPVTILEQRPHIGGNCWSETYPGTDVEYHKYGSHIFHTSHEDVWAYINRFSAFNTYQHKVYTTHRQRVYSLPINLDTINAFYGVHLRPWEVDGFLRAEREKDTPKNPQNFEEQAIALIGKPLYEAFIKGYTQKQWGRHPCELPASILLRLPVRTSYNNRYFTDRYEGIPLHGYGALFTRMLGHPRIRVVLNTPYQAYRDLIPPTALLVYTGAIDAFFNYALGRLEWRTVDFAYNIRQMEDWQGTAVMNYADEDIPWTRVHEFKHYHPERPRLDHTLTANEYSRWATGNDEPYYPVESTANRALYAQYQALAARTPRVLFGGRLGQYTYMNMDATIHAALMLFKRLKLLFSGAVQEGQ